MRQGGVRGRAAYMRGRCASGPEGHGRLLRRLADRRLYAYADRLAPWAYGLRQAVAVLLADELRSGVHRAGVYGGVPRAQALGRRGAEGEVPDHQTVAAHGASLCVPSLRACETGAGAVASGLRRKSGIPGAYYAPVRLQLQGEPAVQHLPEDGAARGDAVLGERCCHGAERGAGPREHRGPGERGVGDVRNCDFGGAA